MSNARSLYLFLRMLCAFITFMYTWFRKRALSSKFCDDTFSLFDTVREPTDPEFYSPNLLAGAQPTSPRWRGRKNFEISQNCSPRDRYSREFFSQSVSRVDRSAARASWAVSLSIPVNNNNDNLRRVRKRKWKHFRVQRACSPHDASACSEFSKS